MKSIILLLLMLLFFEHLFSQDVLVKKQISYDDQSWVVYSKEKTYLYFDAQTPFLQISTTGLNDLELREGTEQGALIPYYEKNKSSQNYDFLFENLKVGQRYYIFVKNDFYEKEKAEIALIAMNQKLQMNRMAKNVKPFQNPKIIVNQNIRQIKN
ncbi:MAG: hypothetical protein KatS3mg035_0500 [Bacteroidia bacterium]|nr:MAG: hypothetical protein KatS3mg035_0500 [Bacteroidia bacterium]